MYADQIKLTFLNWLLPQLGLHDCVGSEIRLLNSQNIADMVLVIDRHIIGIEIKSARDSFRRLNRQAITYTHMFHATYLLLEKNDKKAIANAHKLAPPKFGILLADNSTISVSKEASLKKQISKRWALKWLLRRELEHMLRKRAKHIRDMDIESLRDLAAKSIPATCLDIEARDCVQRRLRSRYEQFVQEIGQVVTADDLHNLHVEPQFIVDG